MVQGRKSSLIGKAGAGNAIWQEDLVCYGDWPAPPVREKKTDFRWHNHGCSSRGCIQHTAFLREGIKSLPNDRWIT
jgi:hypothetical protein